jgi:putative flippase GtrA
MFVSINNNFFLNTYFNFKKKDKILKRWLLFCIIGIVGIFVSDLLLRFFYEVMELDINISKLITIPIIATLQFILHKLITYRK